VSTPDPVNMERLLELLADRAAFGLDAESEALLSRLLRESGEVDAASMDRAAAALASVFAAGEPSTPTTAPPASLLETLRTQGEAAVRSQSGPVVLDRLPRADARDGDAPTYRREDGARRLTRLAWAGWLLAAASLTLAALAWLRPPGQAGKPPKGADVRTVVDAAPGTVSSEWGAWPAKTPEEGGEVVAGAEGVKGRVVWNQALQKGYMVFSGLSPNEASRKQYQLWIIDKAQKNPIDGGVFDIPSTGEVVVPIDAKIAVKEPAGFGLTIEPPGGVVVSDQSRRVVVALLK